ncbi:hypothetical protein L6452_22075 [Arctium lappa]|uniref:Uncharacterized protein n=1 Tax=Arctium lappa TaxID=4217 RepID=A0ACB9AZ24_ARCLA|nr:hypothetical protein L6452_22075 [Arctium lappa]
MGQCNGEQQESGFQPGAPCNGLKMSTLEQPLKEIMLKFSRKMPQLFMDLGEGARAIAFISTFSWWYALDVPLSLTWRIFQSNITGESCRSAIVDLGNLRNGVPSAPPQWRT